MKFGNFPSIDIKINDIGIYFLDEDGGTGKTYLIYRRCDIVRHCQRFLQQYMLTEISNNIFANTTGDVLQLKAYCEYLFGAA